MNKCDNSGALINKGIVQFLLPQAPSRVSILSLRGVFPLNESN